MLKKFTLLTVFLFIVANIGVSASTAAEGINLNEKKRYLLGICTDSKQLDCLEPDVKIFHKDGTTSTAKYISSLHSGPFTQIGSQNTILEHKFEFNSGTIDGPIKSFQVELNFGTPLWFPFGTLSLVIWGVKGANTQSECDAPFKKLCTNFTLDTEDRFQFIVRTQKLPAEDSQGIARDADIVREDYLEGERWIFSGYQAMMGSMPALTWTVTMIGPNHTQAFSNTAQCAKFGLLFRSSNGSAQGQPFWDKSSHSLNFNIYGPHLDQNGDLFMAFFRARLPRKWLECAFPGNSLAYAAEVTTSITYDDGTPQITVGGTRVTEDFIYVDVPNMHFSAPTIRVTNAALVAKATPSPTPKATPKVVTCMKGKTKKKVTATKCPSGWKLVA